MKYLVMECRSAYAVVLGDDGVFQKVANMRYEVGQTVTNVVPLNIPEVTKQPKTNQKRWISSFAAMAACLALIITSIFFTGQTPYASVYMTINPEIRIDVSRSDVVVGVEGINADGTELLNGYDHKKKDLDTVMDELVDRAIDMGYLHEGGKVTLSLDGDEEWIVSHKTHLNHHLNDHLTDKITVTIDIEQKQPEQPTPTAPAGTIVIPVGTDNYGDSDYDDGSTNGESGYGSIGEDGSHGTGSNYDEALSDYDDSDSSYASTDDGNSGYDEPEDDGQTDYGDWSENNADSGYEDPSDYGYKEGEGPSNDTDEDIADQTDYEDTEDTGQTDYDDADDAGQTDYDDTEDASSDYAQADSEYDDSDYNES